MFLVSNKTITSSNKRSLGFIGFPWKSWGFLQSTLVFLPLVLVLLRIIGCFHHNSWSGSPSQVYKIGEDTWGKGMSGLPGVPRIGLQCVALCSPTSSSEEQGMKCPGRFYLEFILQEPNHHGKSLMTNSALTWLVSARPGDWVKVTENFTVLPFNMRVGSGTGILRMSPLSQSKHTS